MAYDPRNLNRHTEAILERAPRIGMAEVVRQLGVDRHTLQRALRKAGVRYKDLQRTATLAAACRLLAGGEPRSIKMAAQILGFPSAEAMSHYLARNVPVMDRFAPKCHLDSE